MINLQFPKFLTLLTYRLTHNCHRQWGRTWVRTNNSTPGYVYPDERRNQKYINWKIINPSDTTWQNTSKCTHMICTRLNEHLLSYRHINVIYTYNKECKKYESTKSLKCTIQIQRSTVVSKPQVTNTVQFQPKITTVEMSSWCEMSSANHHQPTNNHRP